MPNLWNLVPAGLWPFQPLTPQVDPGQGAGFVPSPTGPAATLFAATERLFFR
jgi:hypothetical protein